MCHIQLAQLFLARSDRPEPHCPPGSLCTLGQECTLRPLALLEARKLLQLRRTVDIPAQAKVHDLDIVNGDGFHGGPPLLNTVPDLWECAVTLPIQPPSRQWDVVASHQRWRHFDHKADRISKHIRSVENRWNLIGAVGVDPWEHVRRLTPGYVHRRPFAGDLMSSPKHLHETVGILHPCDALQPRVSNLLSVLTYLRLHLANCLLQRHSRSDLQEAQLRFQPGEQPP